MTQLALDSIVNTGADFSACGTYRYRLWRMWGKNPPVTWIMLNPSTANETENDPTIRRCIGFAREWGYGGVMILNLFALRSTDPRALRSHPDPVGPEWSQWALPELRAASLPIAAWGVHGTLLDRDRLVRKLCEVNGVQLYHMGRTKAGHPKHPLYLPKSTKPTRYDWWE